MSQESPVWLELTNGTKVSIGDNCVLGRGKGCQVVVEDERASRRHAMIHKQEGEEFWLMDLGSANGTRLNDRRLVQPLRLSDRDKIEIGATVLTFRRLQTEVSQIPRTAASVNATVADVRKVNCWLMVADIAGSTQMAHKLKPEDSANLTGAWLANCKKIVEANHGMINKFLGDGFFAYWLDKPGLEAAILKALNELKVLQQKSAPPFRVVLHRGMATSGGAPTLGEESLSGREVNFVFRMEELASSLGNTLFLSQAAADRLRGFGPVASEGAHQVADFEGEYQFFSL